MIAYRTCSFCEATCGLKLDVKDGCVGRVSGDGDDVYSAGYICAKGASIAQLHDDPDRLVEPLIRGPGGGLEPASWQAAFVEVDRRIRPIIAEHGANAVAVYVGNPSGHDLSATLYHRVLHRALGGRRLFTVGTVDQLAKSLSCALMFGSQFIVPVPDIDRSTHVLMLGANPAVSNGSLLVAPDLRRRMRALQARGGKLVVIDPRRTRSAREASEHHFIRPGADAALLAALVHVLSTEGLIELGHGAELINGVTEIREMAQRFSPERVAPACGIAAGEIRRMAHELASAERPVVYGRTGTTTQAFGTMASWLIDVLNVLTGALDRPGGAMFGTPAAEGPTSADTGSGSGVTLGRWHSLGGHPEVLGELPVAALAGEIISADRRRARALLTLAGNPALSTPDGPALEQAFKSLEAMVCHDLYLNETTRHADVLLPATSPLQRPHYPLGIYPNALRNLANFSPAVLEPDADRPADWQIVLRLAGIFAGLGPDCDVGELDRQTVERAVQRRTADSRSPIAGRDPDTIMSALEPRLGPERMLDLLLRCGPYGDHFGAVPDGLTLDGLLAAEHGIDYGALTPRLPGILRTPSGKVELAPELLLGEADRLEAALDGLAERGLVMIGRRDNRSMNSWLHNLANLAPGDGRCTLLMHPDDAARAQLRAGQQVEVSSAAGRLALPLELTEELMPGVVSVPHGWGHEPEATRQRLAVRTPGVNVNRLVDRDLLDPLSGTSVLNGFAVRVEAISI